MMIVQKTETDATPRKKRAFSFFPLCFSALKSACFYALTVILISLAACAPSASAPEIAPNTPDAAARAAMPKQLATLELSATPGDSERAATRAVLRLTEPVPPPPTIPATPTIYVGVFLGAVSSGGEAPANVDIARYEGTLQSEQLTILPTPQCLIAVDAGFGANWSRDPAIPTALGCPTEPPAAYVGTSQLFERGVMYFVPTGEIYTIAIAPINGRYWYVPQAPADQGWVVSAPEGLRMPVFGFGAVWKALDGVRDTIGFARLEEAAVSLTIQRFDRGALVRDLTSGQVFALVGQGGGTAWGPF
ncbi:MAG: hypothetical protein SGI73_20230 [Chloroflexota bacterium]|nr:hypothetical protein [Chloroflexota bacterium]